jgi:ceramide glucosyltransferase
MIVLILYMGILLIKAFLAWGYARSYPQPAVGRRSGAVSICQPILSGDPDLELALEGTLLAVPEAAYIWLVDDADLVAADIAARLTRRHPTHRIQIISLPEPAEGVNPKLFKLEAALRIASAGMLIVLDDDTRLLRKGFEALWDALERCELSTGLPFYRDADNFHGRLLAQFVNNNSALTYLPLLPLSEPVSINGMCYAVKTSTLIELGGFTPILHHLTDDLAVADLVRASGGRIVQTPFPQEVATTVNSLSRYISQMHRWYVFALLLMRRQSPAIYVAMLVLCGLPPILMVIGIVQAVMNPSPLFLSVLGVTLLCRAMVLMLLQRFLSGRVRHRPFLSLLSELLQPLHLLHALLIRSIRWRTRHYRVFDNDRFVSL